MKRLYYIIAAVLLVSLLVVPVCASVGQPAAETDNGYIELTAEEAAYVEGQTDNLTAVCTLSTSPYCTVVDGELIGVLPEVAAIIREKSGLKINLIQPKSDAETTTMIAKGDADIVIDAASTYDWSGKYGYNLSDTYMTVNYSLLKLRSEKARTGKIAVCNQPSTAAVYARKYFTQQLMYLDSADECVEAVKNEECDSAVLSSYMAESIVAQDEKNRYISTSLLGNGEDICLAVNDELPAEVLSIINKTIASFEEGNVERIVSRHIAGNKVSLSLTAIIYRYPGIVVGIVVVVVALVILTLLLVMRNKRILIAFERAEEERRQKELMQNALEAAEKADIAKRRFLSRISHEMRTPLNSIISSMALAKDVEPEMMREFLVNSEASAKRLLDIINAVLDMSAIEDGRITIAHSSFNFKQLTYSITNSYTALCNAKGIRFGCKVLSAIDETIIGDRARLKQILTNLLNNALKFTESGFINMRISLLERNGRNIIVRFEIEDSGCGIPEDMLERIFKPYEQGIYDNSDKSGGSGLGLSIVEGLANLMGGTVRAESKLGEGSTFTVELPFELGSDDDGVIIKQSSAFSTPIKTTVNQNVPQNSTTEKKQAFQKRLSEKDEKKKKADLFTSKKKEKSNDSNGIYRKNVLLVEGKSAKRKTEAELMKKLGIGCDIAENNKAASEKFLMSSKGYYSAVLIDVKASAEDACALVHAIRESQHPNAVSIDIVALMSNKCKGETEKLLSSGANDFIETPFTIEVLQSALEKAFFRSDYREFSVLS